MNRSIWKIPRLLPKQPSCLQQPRSQQHISQSHTRNTYLRAAIISPDIIGQIIHIHNGHRFVPIRMTENKVGYKLGQFVLTKKIVKNKTVKNKSLKKKTKK